MGNIARPTNFEIRGPSWTFVDLRRGPSWNLRGTFVDLRGTFVDLRGLQGGVIFALYITSWTFVEPLWGCVATITGLPAGFPSQAESTNGGWPALGDSINSCSVGSCGSLAGGLSSACQLKVRSAAHPAHKAPGINLLQGLQETLAEAELGL